MVLETSLSGHRPVYVREIVAEAVRREIAVVLATTHEVLDDPGFTDHFGPLAESIALATVAGGISASGLQRLAADSGCDLVIVPDALKYGLPLLFGVTRKYPMLRILIMNDPRWHAGHRPLASLVAGAKLLGLLASAARPGVELLWLRPQGTKPSRRVVIDPLLLEASIEEVEIEASRMRAVLQMDPSVFWFGVVGVLDSRKNIPMVAEALELIASESTQKVGLALLGPWASESARQSAERCLSDPAFPLVQRDRPMTNHEMNVAVAALDCVVMAYSTNAPNSTTAKAAALGVRVAAAGSQTFRRFARVLTGSEGATLEVEGLALEMRASMRRDAPPARELTGAEGLTGPLLAPVPRGPKRGLATTGGCANSVR